VPYLYERAVNLVIFLIPSLSELHRRQQNQAGEDRELRCREGNVKRMSENVNQTSRYVSKSESWAASEGKHQATHEQIRNQK
jgi:hypothetical protein